MDRVASEIAVRSAERWEAAAQAMRRAALAVAQPSGPTLLVDLMQELAASLHVGVAFIAVFDDEARTRMRTLAARLDGRVLRNFDYPLAGSPCAEVVGREFRYVADGVSAEYPPDSMFGAKGMDSYAAFPLADSAGTPLGLLVAMDRRPIADPDLAEALLKIFASRIAAEIERGHADEALRAAALAVSSARGDSVFVQLVRFLATILHVEAAFIARHDADDPDMLRMIALYADGAVNEDVRYPILHTPCATVLGQCFRAYPEKLREHFPHDEAALAEGTESYAGMPLSDLDGAPLGIIGIYSRRPLPHADRIESMLQIFAVRAAAEIERLRADEALRRSEASYRAVFEATEDAIFVHDWDTGAIVDANPKACTSWGYSREELLRLTLADIGSGEAPYSEADARERVEQAKRNCCPRFEWLRRGKDGGLHWHEVSLKPVGIGGAPHVVAFTRDFTERKEAEEALKSSEEQYRAIFEAASDAFVLRDAALRIVGVNPAFMRMSGFTREHLATDSGYPAHFPADYIEERRALVRRALAGEESQLETTLLRADGSTFEADLRVIPVRYRGQPHVLSVVRDITERKRADEALKLREEQYRVIFEAASDAFILRDAQMRVVDVNAAFLRMTGFSREHLESETGYPSHFPAEHVVERHGLVRRALAGEKIELEMNLLRGDGSAFDAEVRVMPLRYRGEPHALSIIRDITERKRAEAALALREEQYRAIFDGAGDALVLWSRDVRIVDVNKAFVEMYGYRRDEVIGGSFGQRLSREEIAERVVLIKRALEGEECQLETSTVGRDGRRFDVELRYLPMHYRGEPHVLAVARDITARRQAEAALALREQQYRAIFDGASDAMALWSRDLRIVDVNRAFTPMFGYTREESIGAEFGRRLPQDEVERRKEMFNRALAGQEVHVETESVRRDGERFAVELRYLPIEHRGEPHVLAITRDITARRRAEAEHTELEARLRQAQKMEAIGQLTGGIAHDFNNILTSVIGYLVLAGERAAPLGDARLAYQLEQAHVAAQRARDFVAQMLTFARRERGERNALALPGLVRRTVQLLRATLPATIELDADTDDAAPPVEADAVQLEQVLFNLCINARDAIGEKSGQIRVRLREAVLPAPARGHCASCRALVPAGRWVELSVADSGSGIEPAVLERMFDPFFTTKEVGRGSGMGLAMVHGIVHDHGGHLCVETVRGAGSRFRVLLPRTATQAAGAAAARDPAPARAPLAGRVLLVEDEAMVGELMTELLEAWGLDVVLKRDAMQARDWLTDPAHDCDLLITDQTMPRMTGLELAKLARAARPLLPVLLYTGNASGFDDAALKAGGVSQALHKPVDPAQLRKVVGRWLGQA